LITTYWNYRFNYNFACPTIAGGACSKADTDCYATALAQVEVPFTCCKSLGANYTNSGNPMQTADFGPVIYTYLLIFNSISGINSELSKFI
jgi:hypothetical protein